MNDYAISILLGIVEGLTEFLPVSSTAHLRLCKAPLGLDLHDPYWKMYDVVIQFGAVLAVVVYFRKRIADFLRSFPRGRDGSTNLLTHPLSMVLIASVVTAIPAYLLDKKIGENLENLRVIGGALLVGGILMWVIDRMFTRPVVNRLEDISYPQAIFIGAAQILAAAFPGTSRSMSTIAAGQISRLSRPAALEFSFFLSIPIMFAAFAYKLIQAVRGKGSGDQVLTMDAHRWGVLAVGFVVSFFVAWAVIAWFMAWVKRRGFVPFAIYRIILGIVVLAVAWKGA
ncbi:undecaprenyl-diphosphate phosphatase [Humisphaera borealis]|uniref:Undecaprenyl-diphosphatase n=1 Tax=Humisphaera borealis TaxID=2807512 RepID=A0A7M2WUA2_9BACT|nr:undecaprenyl-diphosphate phosphatase [Humisphaera borealis]QOV89105.1 undecaprenyl-diphosphate phosphatase [Humisphaera borealis]